MSDLAVTASQVSPAFAHCRLRNTIGGVAIQGGQPCYIDSNGLAQATSSASASTSQFAGIAIPRMNNGYACGAGQACELLEWGECEGFNLSSAAYWQLVYLSDDGGISLTAGTHTAPIGRIVPTTDRDSNGNLRKLLFVFPNWLANVS